MESIIKKKHEGTADEVIGLIAYLSSKCFILTALIIKTIFEILELVTCQLHSHGMLMTTNIFKNVILQIKELRNNSSFKKVILVADGFSEKSKVEFLPHIESAKT